MNASNVPLNDEEQRNAKFQGPFKWFIQRVAQKYSEPLHALGLFSRRDLVRMTDTRVYSEIIHTIENGFVTTRSPEIDTLYRKYNTIFNEEDLYFSYLEGGIELIMQENALHEKELLRGYMFQTLALIFIDRKFGLGLLERAREVAPDTDAAVQGNPIDVAILVDALRDPEDHPQLNDFIEATKGTNVARAKAIRFLYLAPAV